MSNIAVKEVIVNTNLIPIGLGLERSAQDRGQLGNGVSLDRLSFDKIVTPERSVFEAQGIVVQYAIGRNNNTGDQVVKYNLGFKNTWNKTKSSIKMLTAGQQIVNVATDAIIDKVVETEVAQNGKVVKVPCGFIVKVLIDNEEKAIPVTNHNMLILRDIFNFNYRIATNGDIVYVVGKSGGPKADALEHIVFNPKADKSSVMGIFDVLSACGARVHVSKKDDFDLVNHFGENFNCKPFAAKPDIIFSESSLNGNMNIYIRGELKVDGIENPVPVSANRVVTIAKNGDSVVNTIFAAIPVSKQRVFIKESRKVGFEFERYIPKTDLGKQVEVALKSAVLEDGLGDSIIIKINIERCPFLDMSTAILPIDRLAADITALEGCKICEKILDPSKGFLRGVYEQMPSEDAVHKKVTMSEAKALMESDLWKTVSRAKGYERYNKDQLNILVEAGVNPYTGEYNSIKRSPGVTESRINYENKYTKTRKSRIDNLLETIDIAVKSAGNIQNSLLPAEVTSLRREFMLLDPNNLMAQKEFGEKRMAQIKDSEKKIVKEIALHKLAMLKASNGKGYIHQHDKNSWRPVNAKFRTAGKRRYAAIDSAFDGLYIDCLGVSIDTNNG